MLPAGKSGHLELGYMIGQGKPGYILLDAEHKRWDVMYKFATAVVPTMEELCSILGTTLNEELPFA
jgi:nucleoside 2-deoxyribosyltransferase